MIWNLILIQVICVVVIDVLGAVDEMLTPLFRKITGSKIGHIGKPLSCSTCMTFWISLIWLIATGNFTLPWIAFILILAVFAPLTYLIISFLKDAAIKQINELYDIFEI